MFIIAQFPSIIHFIYILPFLNMNKLISKFGIHIKCSDIRKSYKFYKTFGFKEVFAYGPKKFLSTVDKNHPAAPEKYRGVVFEVGNTIFEIADGHIAVKPNVFKEKITSSKVSAMLHVDSVDKIIKICKKNSIKITVSPRIFPWGTKEIVIKDPDGFVLVFIEKLKK